MTAIVEQAIKTLIEAAPPGASVIVFGSHARGNAGEQSDVDFLVVEPELPTGRRAEMVRLRQVLRPLRIPADVLVVSRRVFEEWKNTPNTVIFEAARQGKVYDGTAGST